MSMPRLVFKHLRNTENVGDRWCSPYDYLPFDDAVAMDLAEPTPPCEAVIFGGGKIFGSLAEKLTPNDKLAKHRIAWGVSTVQSSIFSLGYGRSRRSMTMVGSRDYGDSRYDYAPCVTCMSPLFDLEYPSQHDLVFYLHKTKSRDLELNLPDGMPTLSNYCSSIEEAVSFIGSGEVVVSNSYHGVYWALLLRKKVLCLPFSKKFSHYRFAPTYSDVHRWSRDVGKAAAHPDMLAICREASLAFENKVRRALK